MQLLKLRFYQIKRDLSYWVFIIAAAAFYLSKEISEAKINYAIGFAAIAIVALYNYHANRKDLNFLDKYFKQPYWQVFAGYTLVLLPISIALLLNSFWYLALLVHLLPGFTSLARLRAGHLKLLFIGRYLPAGQFEWISGTRKNFYPLLLLYVLALVLSPVKLFGPAALLLFNFIILGFYSIHEPLLMLNPRHLPVEKFLAEKVAFLHRAVLILNVPVLVVNSIFNADVAWFNAGFLLAFLLLSACTIYLKYSHYRPNTSSGFSIDFLALTAAVVLPYLLPLALLIYFSSRKKAIAHLLYLST